MNFSTFYSQAVKDKSRKIKKGKYKGQMKGITSKELKLPGPAVYKNPNSGDPSGSTFTLKG